VSSKKTSKREKKMPVWTYEQARRGLPYVASVVTSVRDHYLEAQQHDLARERLAKKPGRPDRKSLIAQEDASREGRLARERLDGDLEELLNIGVYSLDPLRGEALIPFVRDEQLAWFIFELFGEEQLRHWRYHNDSLTMRRPIAEVVEGPPSKAVIV
jgi:hypothetical protein